MFSLSTAWHSDTVLNVEQLLREIVDLGITGIELEPRIAEEAFCRMIPLFYEYKIDVHSLHSFFPKPDKTILNREDLGIGLAAESEEVLEEALRLYKKTLDYAHDLECKAIVVHLGNLMMDSRQDEQIALIEAGRQDSPEYRGLVEAVTDERKSLACKAFARVLKGIELLNDLAEEREVLIGVETRVAINEIPSLDETREILKRFSGSRIKYWIDVGHAHIQSKLGWYDIDEFYGLVAEQAVGAHIHDVQGFEDHFAPGTGDVDFVKFKSYLPETALRVVEVLSKTGKDELVRGLKYLESQNIINSNHD